MWLAERAYHSLLWAPKKVLVERQERHGKLDTPRSRLPATTQDRETSDGEIEDEPFAVVDDPFVPSSQETNFQIARPPVPGSLGIAGF
jgi:hypothetical protein